MTYKCALAGVRYGGGKAVIIGDPKEPKSRELLTAYAKKINILNGLFYTGEDVGLTLENVAVMAETSSYIIGRKHLAGELGPWVAMGLMGAIRAALKQVFGSAKVSGRSFAIKGLGKVGLSLCHDLYRENAKIIAADVDPKAVLTARRAYPKILIASPKEIHRRLVDVYSPCALGGEFTRKTISQLKCRIICGGANNQLMTPEDGKRIFKRGVLYIPDYIANAGGLINVVGELEPGGYNADRVRQKILALEGTVQEVIGRSAAQHLPTSVVADNIGERIFNGLH